MIQRVSSIIPSYSFGNAKTAKKSNLLVTSKPEQARKTETDTFQKKYLKSFAKHFEESTPMLLGFTSLWAVLDNGKNNIPIAKSLLTHLATFYIPVAVGSSLIMAGIENKKTSKSSN